MGFTLFPIVCNMYMESFEQKALATADPLLKWWKRYVDDTHTILKKEYSQGFTEHINRIDENMKWITEEEVKNMRRIA